MKAAVKPGERETERGLHPLGSERPVGSWQQQPWAASALPFQVVQKFQAEGVVGKAPILSPRARQWQLGAC